MHASTSVLSVDEVRILAMNAPADGSGVALLEDVSFDFLDIEQKAVGGGE
jgi:hypothetical protein